MAIVQFQQYRRHERAWIEANDAIMALLVGSHLAGHTLRLTEGSKLLLPEIFPDVPHVKRFARRSSSARLLLADAESHLSAMAAAYILAVHEDFVQGAIALLKVAGAPEASGTRPKAWEMHEDFARRVGGIAWGPRLDCFHIARLLRNCIIHTGGVADEALVGWIAVRLSGEGEKEWTRRTDRSPKDFVVGRPIEFANAELFTTLAATRALAKLINEALQPALPRSMWADMTVAHIADEVPQILGTDPRQIRKCAKFAKQFYGPLALTETEITSAFERMATG